MATTESEDKESMLRDITRDIENMLRFAEIFRGMNLLDKARKAASGAAVLLKQFPQIPVAKGDDLRERLYRLESLLDERDPAVVRVVGREQGEAPLTKRKERRGK
jgi:hypothetical protein